MDEEPIGSDNKNSSSLEERELDLQLGELLNAETPPDLKASILSAAKHLDQEDSCPVGEFETLEQLAGRGSKSRIAWWQALGISFAAASLLVVLGITLFASSSQPDESTANLAGFDDSQPSNNPATKASAELPNDGQNSENASSGPAIKEPSQSSASDPKQEADNDKEEKKPQLSSLFRDDPDFPVAKGQRALVGDGGVITDRQLRTLSALDAGALVSFSIPTIGPTFRGEVTDTGVTALSPYTSLEKLDLYGHWKITNDGARSLAGLTELRVLILSYTSVDDEALRELDSLSRLEELHLCGCANITDLVFDYLIQFENLRRLEVWECDKLSIDGLRKLKTLRNLRELGVVGCDGISAEDVDALKLEMPGLDIRH